MRRAHSCPTMDAPRYGRGSSALVAAARSSASLMATLTGSSERFARLKLGITARCFAQRMGISSLSSPGSISGPPAAALACRAIRRGAGSLGHAPFAQVAGDHRLANERHGSEQEFDYGIARPISERLRQVDILASARQVR